MEIKKTTQIIAPLKTQFNTMDMNTWKREHRKGVIIAENKQD
jgi:hypothetical protein